MEFLLNFHFWIANNPYMVIKYKNFSELASHEQEEIDYQIHYRNKNSTYAIMAPHGGWIERGTRQITDAIAGQDYAYYCFEGLKPHSQDLHISSGRFDEPRALSIATQVDIVITLHGAYGSKPDVLFGGLHEELIETFIVELNKRDFNAGHDPSPTRQGKSKTNICNRGKQKKGVQIEMTQGFRKSLFNKPDNNLTHWVPNDRFNIFVETVRSVLNDHSSSNKTVK